MNRKALESVRIIASRRLPQAAGTLSLLLLVILVGGGRSWGQANQEFDNCAKAVDGDPDTAIQLCTEAIEGGHLTGANLRGALNNRGIAYKNKGDNEHAIADYNHAIDLNPNDDKALNNLGAIYMNMGDNDRAIAAYNKAIDLVPEYGIAIKNRGSAYINKGEYETAMKDYTRLIELNPRNSFALQTRGILQFYLGHFEEALKDEMDSVNANPADSYSAIWLYLAHARKGEDAKSELAANASNLKLDNWPGPVVQVLLERAKPDDLVSLGRAANPKFATDRECEANFYLGERALIGGNQAEALRRFKAAVATGAMGNLEYRGAVQEMSRLDQTKK